MRLGFGGALLLSAGLGLSLLTGPASAVPVDGSAESYGVQPVNAQPRATFTFLPACETATAMNCVESIEYKVADEWLTATGPTPQQSIESDDGEGNIVYGETRYIYGTPGLVHEGGRGELIAQLVERDDINGPPYAGYGFALQAHPHGTDVVWDPAINRCLNGDPRFPGTDPCWRAPWLADTEYRYTFRTSTLIPVFAQSTVVGMTTSMAEVPGGLRVSIAGRPGGSQWILDQDVAEKADRFDAVTYEWGGFLSDIRARNGVLAECQGMGLASAYSNGNGGQMPEWDARTGSLSFGVSGLHYEPNGSVYKGEAEVFVPGELARCMWKVDPRQTARMEIEVFAENGEEVAGTKAISYDARADVVKLIATNFTYSEKQIVARPTPLSASPGKRVCDSKKVTCVQVDRSRKGAKVTLTKVKGTSQVLAVALRGTREDGGTQVSAQVKKGKATFSLKLSGAKAKGQVWILRSPSAFISSFEVR